MSSENLNSGPSGSKGQPSSEDAGKSEKRASLARRGSTASIQDSAERARKSLIQSEVVSAQNQIGNKNFGSKTQSSNNSKDKTHDDKSQVEDDHSSPRGSKQKDSKSSVTFHSTPSPRRGSTAAERRASFFLRLDQAGTATCPNLGEIQSEKLIVQSPENQLQTDLNNQSQSQSPLQQQTQQNQFSPNGNCTNMAVSEIQFAEFEQKMRKLVIQMLEPTILRSSQFSTQMEGVHKELDRLVNELSSVRETSRTAVRASESLQKVVDDVRQSDLKRKDFQLQTRDELALFETRLAGFSLIIEEKENRVNEVRRLNDSNKDEIIRVRSALESCRRDLTADLITNDDRLNETKNVFEVKVVELEATVAKLVDKFFDFERLIGKVTSENKKRAIETERCEQKIDDLEGKKADNAVVTQRMDGITEKIDKLEQISTRLQENIERASTQFKDHFTTATNAVTSQMTELMRDTKKDINVQLQSYESSHKAIRDLMDSFERDDFRTAHDTLRCEMQDRIDQLHREIAQIERKHRKDFGILGVRI